MLKSAQKNIKICIYNCPDILKIYMDDVKYQSQTSGNEKPVVERKNMPNGINSRLNVAEKNIGELESPARRKKLECLNIGANL